MHFSSVFALGLCISLTYATDSIDPNYFNFEYYPKLGIAYKFFKTALAWGDARKHCLAQNATLAMPKTKEELDVIMTIRNKNPSSVVTGSPYPDWMLLGFHDFFVENQFMTEEGFTMDYYYQDFDNGQPGQGVAENCGSVYINGRYHDYPCLSPACFICQKEDDSYGKQLLKINQIKSDKRYKHNPSSGKKYRLSTDLLTWGSAQTICFAEGGNLAVIRNRQEMDFLADMLNDPKNFLKYPLLKNMASVGFHDFFVEDEFVSVLGEDLHEYNYLRWAIGQPNGSTNENCAALDTNGYLQDVNCNIPNLYICEKDEDSYGDNISSP